MLRIDWTKVPKETKEQIFRDAYMMDAPCSWQEVECPMAKYGIDCERDNDNHCAFRDFIFQCLQIKNEVNKCK